MSGRGADFIGQPPGSPYIVAVHADAGERPKALSIWLRRLPTSLSEANAPIIETNRRVEWDRKEGRIVAAVEARLGALLLSTRRLTPTDEEAAPILCEVIRTTPGILVSAKMRDSSRQVGLMRRTFLKSLA
jgi:hypothetical protein